jgi:hypothetical protein
LATLETTVALAKLENAQLLVSFAGRSIQIEDLFMLCPFDCESPLDSIFLSAIDSIVEGTRSCLLFLDCNTTGPLAAILGKSSSTHILVPTNNAICDGNFTSEFVNSLNVLTAYLPGKFGGVHYAKIC